MALAMRNGWVFLSREEVRRIVYSFHSLPIQLNAVPAMALSTYVKGIVPEVLRMGALLFVFASFSKSEGKRSPVYLLVALPVTLPASIQKKTTVVKGALELTRAFQF
jgi:hypothetical protein